MNKTRIVIIFLVCIILVGCDRYSNVRPAIDVNEIWVSDEPQIYFVGWDETEEKSMGIIKNEEQEIKMFIYFDYGTGIICERYSAEKQDEEPINEIPVKDIIFRGTCKFGKDKLVVKDIKFEDDIFNGSVDTITFERRSLEEWLKEKGEEIVETTTEEV